MKKVFSSIFLLTLLVAVTSCRTTRNVSTNAQSGFVGVSHETDCASDEQTLTLRLQRFLSPSIDILFFTMPVDDDLPTAGLILDTLLFEEAETAQPRGASRSRHPSSNVRVYGIHLADSTGLQADGQSASKRDLSLADSVSQSLAVLNQIAKRPSSPTWRILLRRSLGVQPW